jgi:hypothetical protein
MLRNILCVAVLTAAATLATSSTARAWGAYHVGYTHVGPSGVQHYGHTAGYGSNGAYSGSHYGSYNRSGSSDRYGSYKRSGSSYHYGSSDRYGSSERYSSYRRGW